MHNCRLPPHLLRLSYAVSSSLRLEVVLRVPVRIKYHHGVGSGQVHPQAPSSGGEEEAEILRTLCIEVVDGIFAGVATNRAVQSLKEEKLVRFLVWLTN